MRAFKLKVFSPCMYVTRHSAAKTVSRDVASSPRPSPNPSSPFAAQCSPLALRPSLFSQRSQKLLIYLSYERALAGSKRATEQRGGEGVENRSGERKEKEEGGREEGWEGGRKE